MFNPFRKRWAVTPYDPFTGESMTTVPDQDRYLVFRTKQEADLLAKRCQAFTDIILRDTNWRVIWRVDRIG